MMIVVRNPKSDDREPPKNFSFDAVFGPDSLQKNVYDTCAASVVDSVLNGYNGTIFAYGQVSNNMSILFFFSNWRIACIKRRILHFNVEF